MSNVRSYEFTFDGSNPAQFRGGEYFTIEDSTSDLDVTIKDQFGKVVGFVENVGAGFWIKIPDSGSIEVNSAVAQTASFIIGSGEFGVNKTTTSISGGTLTPRTLVTNYSSSNVGTGATTIVAPGTNTDGIRIDQAMSKNLNTGIYAVLAKTSAPTGITDTAARSVFVYYYTTTANYPLIQQVVEMPYIIPAGEGLYVYGQVAGATLSIDYEVL